jgi:hypothetical protein
LNDNANVTDAPPINRAINKNKKIPPLVEIQPISPNDPPTLKSE